MLVLGRQHRRVMPPSTATARPIALFRFVISGYSRDVLSGSRERYGTRLTTTSFFILFIFWSAFRNSPGHIIRRGRIGPQANSNWAYSGPIGYGLARQVAGFFSFGLGLHACQLAEAQVVISQ